MKKLSSRKLRVGIVGAGGISKNCHIPAWKKVPDVEIVAIADIHEPTLNSMASEFQIPETFTDFHQMMRLDLDIVDVCTPNRLHTPAVMAALQSGKHVLCEKPLATTTAEIRKMGMLADRKKLKLMTGQNQRYSAASQTIKKWAQAGALGEVYHAQVQALRRAWLPPRPGFIDHKLSGGGPCMDIGVHALDACLWMMNFPKPVRVTGTAKVNFAKGYKIPGMWGEWDRNLFSVEDFASGFVHFDNGATLTLEAAWLGHQEEKENFSFRLYGLEAGIHWPSMRYATAAQGTLAQGTLTPVQDQVITHQEEIADFARCVRENGHSPVPWRETIRTIAILEAIYKSSKIGKEVQLPSNI